MGKKTTDGTLQVVAEPKGRGKEEGMPWTSQRSQVRCA